MYLNSTKIINLRQKHSGYDYPGLMPYKVSTWQDKNSAGSYGDNPFAYMLGREWPITKTKNDIIFLREEDLVPL